MSDKERDIKNVQDRIIVLSHEKRVYEDEIFDGRNIPTWEEIEHINGIQKSIDNLNLVLNLLTNDTVKINWEEFISKLA